MKMPLPRSFRAYHGQLWASCGAALFALCAPGAMAASAPDARLISCKDGSCLLVSGRRADPAAQVRINGHQVPVDGRRAWKVRLPVHTVRAWSAPMARTIDVMILEPGSGAETIKRAELPIGLLGQNTNLAALVIGSG